MNVHSRRLFIQRSGRSHIQDLITDLWWMLKTHRTELFGRSQGFYHPRLIGEHDSTARYVVAFEYADNILTANTPNYNYLAHTLIPPIAPLST